jgi:hypothetical protein
VVLTLPSNWGSRVQTLSVTGNTGWTAAQLSEFEIFG